MESATARTDQIQILIAVEIHHFGIKSESDLVSRRNDGPFPRPRFRKELVGANNKRIVFAGILSIVTQVTTARDQFRLLISIKICPKQAMSL